MTEQRVSFRYAKAIIETAEAEKITDLLYKDFMYVREVCEYSHELTTFIKSPIVHERDKKKVFKELFEKKINSVTLNFLNFLIEKSRANYTLDIIVQYEELYNKLNNKIKVDITTAVELEDAAKNKIVDKISDNTGKTILSNFNVKKEIDGGLLVRINDWVYDATLKRQLKNLYNTLAKN
jgi:F-type H+-transporting ATPase subunit delta